MAQVKNFYSQSLGIISSSSEFDSAAKQKVIIETYCNSQNLQLNGFIDVNKLSEEDFINRVKNNSDVNYICTGLYILPSYLSKLEDLLWFVADIGKHNSYLISIYQNIDSSSEAHVFVDRLMRSWRDIKKIKLTYNARASLLKAQKRNHKIGRKLKRDDRLIRQLRSEGFTIREIAAKTHVSTTAVIRSLKTLEKTPEHAKKVHDQSPV
jgi:DNA invertase Pin-like site-specific DNA recombinase